MNTLGDNVDKALPTLGGFRIAGSTLRKTSVRRGSILYATRGEFSIMNRASTDRQEREEASSSRQPVSAQESQR
jgi:hypothetical protein